MSELNITKAKGLHLKRIRSYMGLSQKEFSEWLFSHGTTGKYSEPYDVKTIAAMENGRRNVPDKVLATIRENYLWEGEKINWSFLTGETEYITYSSRGIVEETFRIQENLSEWVKSDIRELANDPTNKFAIALMDEILPVLGHSKMDIKDWSRFTKYMQENIRALIDNYIVMLDNDGK